MTVVVIFLNFLTRFAPQAIDVDYMVNTFNSIIDSYLYDNGYVNYRHAGTMFGEIQDFMENLRNLLDQGLIIETASIITEIALGFDEIPLDDSDGHTSGFYDSVKHSLQTSSKKMSP